MGNSCCQMRQNGKESVHRRSASSVAPSGNRPGNPGLSSDRGLRCTQRRQEGTLTTPSKPQRVNTEHQQLAPATTAATASHADEPHILKSNEAAPVTTAATANQVDESHTPKSKDEKTTSSDCSLVADDACKKSKISNSLLLPLTIENEEDVCPTCLDGYDEENPKILTACKHHYHLACIYEWMERSNTCPMCEKVMVFEEPS